MKPSRGPFRLEIARTEITRIGLIFRRGGMAEWSMAVVLKTEAVDLQNSRISA
jgi:hypothetical protein